MPKIIHTMIRVRDLNAALKFYADALDMRVSHRLDFPDFSLVYLRNPENDFEIELTWNKGKEEPYAHGDGYGHMAFAVDDLDAEREEMMAAGIEAQPIKEFKREDELLARFFFIKDPDGYKIEVLQRGGHYM